MILVFGGVYQQVFKVKDTTCETPELNKLMELYLLMSLAWLFRHLILVILGCLCLPVLLIMVWIFGGGPKKASNVIFVKVIGELIISYRLPLKSFQLSHINLISLVIKNVPFVWSNMKKMIKLLCLLVIQCNFSYYLEFFSFDINRHYFHEDCGKKWLGINGQCPICRARVDGKKDEPNPNNNNNN